MYCLLVISPATIPSFQFIPDIDLLPALHMLFICWEHSFFLPQAFPSHPIWLTNIHLSCKTQCKTPFCQVHLSTCQPCTPSILYLFSKALIMFAMKYLYNFYISSCYMYDLLLSYFLSTYSVLKLCLVIGHIAVDSRQQSGPCLLGFIY